MIQTYHYRPVDPEKFRRNFVRRWMEYSDRIAHFNSRESLSKRVNGELIYHVMNATVFVDKPEKEKIVSITTEPREMKAAKSLLEEISKVKLMEKI